ncbi:MAG: hypothetical protein ACPGNT_04735 [Rhodospirillales bacterium]
MNATTTNMSGQIWKNQHSAFCMLCYSAELTVGAWRMVLGQWGRLLDHPWNGRDETLNKDVPQASPCCGAELDDHYGRRAHDVDVEKI